MTRPERRPRRLRPAGLTRWCCAATAASAWWAAAQPARAQAEGTAPAAQPAPLAEISDIEPASPDDLDLTSGRDFTRRRYLLERIEVVGNRKTERREILRALPLVPGELLNEEKVLSARVKLLALGYFRDVTFRLERGTQKGSVVLVVEVEERNTLLVDGLALGFSRSERVFGGLGVTDFNFLGKGFQLGGAFVASPSQSGFRLRFTNPSVRGSGNLLGVTLLYNDGREVGLRDLSPGERPQDTSAVGFLDDVEVKEKIEYRRAGGRATAGFGVGPFRQFVLEYRFEGIETRCRNYPGGGVIDPCPDAQAVDAAATVLPQDTLRGRSYLSSMVFGYGEDTRDNAFIPTTGHSLAVQIELGTELLGSDYPFSKYTISGELVLPAFLDHRLRLRGFGGLVQGQTPFFNKFFRADFAYFSIDKRSLPRVLELNVSELSDEITYDPVIFSGGTFYDVPLWGGGDFLYRSVGYVGLDVTVSGTVDEFAARDRRPQERKQPFPLSADIGLRFDTKIGLFVLSASYWLDVIL